MIFQFPFLIFFNCFPYWYATGPCQERKQEWKLRSTSIDVSGVLYLIDSKQILWQPKHLTPLILHVISETGTYYAPVTGAAADEYNLNVVDCNVSVTVARRSSISVSGGLGVPPD